MLELVAFTFKIRFSKIFFVVIMRFFDVLIQIAVVCTFVILRFVSDNLEPCASPQEMLCFLHVDMVMDRTYIAGCAAVPYSDSGEWVVDDDPSPPGTLRKKIAVPVGEDLTCNYMRTSPGFIGYTNVWDSKDDSFDEWSTGVNRRVSVCLIGRSFGHSVTCFGEEPKSFVLWTFDFGLLMGMIWICTGIVLDCFYS